MIVRLTVTVPVDDPLSFLVPDPRFKQEIEPYFMSRIIDVEKFVAQYPFAAADRPSELALAIDDGDAPWNAGNYRLRIEADGSAGLTRVAAVEGSPARWSGAACDIATLTAMLVGGRRPAWLHRIGRLTGPDEQVGELERRVPAQRPYLADFF